jgi:hypothetical protein
MELGETTQYKEKEETGASKFVFFNQTIKSKSLIWAAHIESKEGVSRLCVTLSEKPK